MAKNISKQTTVEFSKILTKPFILIWDENNKIETKEDKNDTTYPRVNSFSEEFDSVEELEQFIIDNGLIE